MSADTLNPAIVMSKETTHTWQDRESELKRLLRLTFIMFVVSLLVAVVLGFQLRADLLQIDRIGSTMFSALRHDAELTLFVDDPSSRDGVHGALETDPGHDRVLVGLKFAKWQYNFESRSLQAEDGRYMTVNVGPDTQYVTVRERESIVADTYPIDLFVEPWTNRIFVYCRGFWLVRAAYDARSGGQIYCIWTRSTLTVPELYFGLWSGLRECSKERIQKGVLCG